MRIDSNGIPVLEIIPGPDGLQIHGNIVLIWNGVKAYEGPVTEEPIRLALQATKP